MKAKEFKAIAFSCAGVLLALLLVLSIAIGVFSKELDKFVVGYKESGADSAARAKSAELAEQIQDEGIVMVKNDSLLPLKKAEASKVNVFGWAVTDWVLSGSGSGQVKRANSVDLLTALKDYGIDYNTQLTDMYKKFRPYREYSQGGSHSGAPSAGNPNDSGSLHSFNYEFSRLYEPAIDDTSYYTVDMLNNAKNYSDTAFVVIGRVSGESNDSPAVQYKQTAGTNKQSGMLSEDKIDRNRTYLEISEEEEKLLTYVGENFKNVVVLINSTNVMELGFMETIPGLDACLVVATTGTVGAKSVPKVIYGDVNPSGKLADTYAYDLSTASTYVDTGKGNDTTHFYTNGNGLYPTNVQHTNGSSNVPYTGVAYQDYRESIYVGYKWYETADTEGFWDSNYAKTKWGITNGYKDVVQYPFGYGLSYTEFEWEVTNIKTDKVIGNGATVDKDDVVEILVRVTNVGETAGQDVVELYYSTPYETNGKIEQASVNLLAFGKTQKILKKGEHEDVKLSFTVSDMASYDYLSVKTTNGGYVLEKGEYGLSFRTDAHTLATDKLIDSDFLKGDTLTLNIAQDTRCNEESENRFTGTNTTDGVAIDGNSDGSAEITYLSRKDFERTFPAEFGENRAMTDEIKSRNLFNTAWQITWDAKWAQENGNPSDPVFGSSTTAPDYFVGKEVEKEFENADGSTTKKKVYELNELGLKLGTDYDADEWEELLNHIPQSQMEDLVLHGYVQTKAVQAINKPQTEDRDGPNQAASFSDGHANAVGFSSITLAQTWNLELAYSMGLTFGAYCAENGITGWYGPGVNVHRSPFGGRNYEYYSEDALMSGLMCAKVVSAAKNRGVFSYLKHICLYEGESGRDGMYTWLTEQALREIYLRPFEIAVRRGGSNAIMTSYGRIGAVWTGGSEALLTEVCREEWGFKGAFLTDYADHHDFMNGDQMIRAGGDIWMDGWNSNGSFTNSMKSTTAYKYALRNATKNVLYMWMNTLATNATYNESADDIVIPVTPELNFRWYIPVIIVVDVLLAAGAGVLIFFAIRKKDKPVTEAAAESTASPASPTDDSETPNE